jgi:hypothetical protein
MHSTPEYDASVLDVAKLRAKAIDIASRANGYIPTTRIAEIDAWELGRVYSRRDRTTELDNNGQYAFLQNDAADLVALTPTGELWEMRFTLNATKSPLPPMFELGSTGHTRWDEAEPFSADWHYQLLDVANIGLYTVGLRTGTFGTIVEESLQTHLVTITEQRGRGLELALDRLLYLLP